MRTLRPRMTSEVFGDKQAPSAKPPAPPSPSTVGLQVQPEGPRYSESTLVYTDLQPGALGPLAMPLVGALPTRCESTSLTRTQSTRVL